MKWLAFHSYQVLLRFETETGDSCVSQQRLDGSELLHHFSLRNVLRIVFDTEISLCPLLNLTIGLKHKSRLTATVVSWIKAVIHFLLQTVVHTLGE